MPSVQNLTLLQKKAIVAQLPDTQVTAVFFVGTDGSGNALLRVSYNIGVTASYSIDATGVATLTDLV